MDLRRKIVIGTFLVAAGFAAGVVFREPIRNLVAPVGDATPAEWAEQVRLDALALHVLVRPDPRLPETLAEQPEFWEAWDARRALYPPEPLRDLRRRLHDYLDFLEAEAADCAEIWRTGPRERLESDAARDARRRVREAFGAGADGILAEAEERREEAYRASPKVAGYDPDLPDFGRIDVETREWLPRARARVDELTAPPAR